MAICARGDAAWDHRVRTSAVAKLRFIAKAFREALRKPETPVEWPNHTRGSILIDVRMHGPIPPPPMTPLPDEESN